MAEGFTIAAAITSAGTVFDSMLTILTGNPIFVCFIGAALIPVGFRIFKAAKRAVR